MYRNGILRRSLYFLCGKLKNSICALVQNLQQNKTVKEYSHSFTKHLKENYTLFEAQTIKNAIEGL